MTSSTSFPGFSPGRSTPGSSATPAPAHLTLPSSELRTRKTPGPGGIFTSSHPGLCSFSPRAFKALFDPRAVSFASIPLKDDTALPNLLLQRPEGRPPPEPPEARRPPIQKSPVLLVKTDEAPAGRHPQTEHGQNRLLEQRKRSGRQFKLWLFPPA